MLCKHSLTKNKEVCNNCGYCEIDEVDQRLLDVTKTAKLAVYKK